MNYRLTAIIIDSDNAYSSIEEVAEQFTNENDPNECFLEAIAPADEVPLHIYRAVLKDIYRIAQDFDDDGVIVERIEDHLANLKYRKDWK
ncbi:MAG: hypothetical protein PHY47_01300 [Lachnospiraceae bacterium]|nr:hypothetical protein [Lachnospiraceae bacterium]